MKKTKRTGKPVLQLRREHIRLLTPTDLQQVVGGAGTRPTKSDMCGTNTHMEGATC